MMLSSWPVSPRRVALLLLAAPIGAALLFAGVAAAPGATTPADGLGPHDSNAPVNYQADRIELMEKADRVALSGNVVITQGDLTMHSPRAVVAYTNQGSMKIQRLDATGGVIVVRGDETASGDVATYDFNGRIITMVGNVVVRRGNGDVQRSQRLVIDLNTHLTTTDAGPGGRVSGTFQVPKHDQKAQ